MIEVEVFGADALARGPSADDVRGLCLLAAGAFGASHGHVAVEFIDARRMAALNAEHRGKPEPTDVLSFPVDGLSLPALGLGESAPRELGDVMICPELTADVREAVIHGVLHLLGMDHETDDGEMLELQSELLAGRSP
jgi:probable rRNA maturation factor